MSIRSITLGAAFLFASVAAASSATVTVQVNDIESGEGQIYVGLCDRGFEEALCIDGKFQAARPGTMTFTFENVPPGTYAIAAYHDVNGNGRMDTGTFSLPKEPYGFSNDVGRIAPPNFLAATIPVSSPGATITVRMARMIFGG
ncbi:MAG TPA: DUF2141 domain-containing protein [Saliniramus sp.]|nr:DUF2141 domain-containing protein [Saliniramus sp.]